MSRTYKYSQDVPNHVLCERLMHLAEIISTDRSKIDSEFTMRIPPEVDRDPDLVLSEAARRIERMQERLDNSIELTEEQMNAIRHPDE